MTLDTVFRWASLTKPLVAATTLALVERGLLDLSDPVTRFLPDFTPRLPDGTAPVITVRHLLTHTAGLAYPSLAVDDPYEAANVSTGMDQPGLSIQENLQRIVSVPLYFPPGSAWRYSVAIDVLGAVIAGVHGGSLGDAVATYVSDPLGMHDSTFLVRDPARLAVPYADGTPHAVRMRDPHRVGDLVFSPARAFDERSFQSGGGGMVGTADDFMTFLEALRTGGGPILRRETVALATRNQIGGLREPEDPGWGFGLLSGVLIDPDRAGSPSAVGTLSWGGVYGHSWFLDMAAGLSVVALTNTAVEGCLGAFPVDIRAAIYAAVLEGSRPALNSSAAARDNA
jgi:CubicO group peptidase (beta-lactamase class C family)